MPWRLLHGFVTSTAVYYTQRCTCLFAAWGRAWEQRGKRGSGQYHVECRATSNAFASGRCRFPSNAALQACTRWEIPLSSERLVTKPGRSFTPFGFKGFPPICESPRILRMWVNTKLIKLQVCRSPSHSGSEHDWGWAFGKRCKRPQPVYSLSCHVTLAASWMIQMWIGTDTYRDIISSTAFFKWPAPVNPCRATGCARPFCLISIISNLHSIHSSFLHLMSSPWLHRQGLDSNRFSGTTLHRWMTWRGTMARTWSSPRGGRVVVSDLYCSGLWRGPKGDAGG